MKQTSLKAALLAGLGIATFAGIPMSASLAAEGDSPWMVRVRGLSVQADEGGSVSIGGAVKIDEDIVPELDITYFFSDNIAAELILATTNHDVSHSTVGSLGDVNLLPPTLTLQYHFTPDAQISPYVGAGVNYTFFYNEDGAPGLPIDYDDSFGWALQAGVDVKIDDNWRVNLDVKKIFLSTDVSIAGGAVTADVDIDPWIIGLGVGYRF